MRGELEKADAHVQTVTRQEQENEQTGPIEHSNCFKNIDIG
jgi:hypothetical protein